MFAFVYLLGLLFLFPFAFKYLSFKGILIFLFLYTLLSGITLICLSPWSEEVLWCFILLALLLALTISDFATMEVSTFLLCAFALWAFLYVGFCASPWLSLKGRLFSVLLYLLPLFLYGHFRKQSFGEADLIFIGVSTFVLGFYWEAYALLLASCSAMLYYLYQRKQRRLKRNMPFPFLPFLALGFYSIFVFCIQKTVGA